MGGGEVNGEGEERGKQVVRERESWEPQKVLQVSHRHRSVEEERDMREGER